MQTLKIHYHPDVLPLDNKTIFKRLATRAIVTKGNSILLMYTKRYEDYSLPGGGLDDGENNIEGMIRELSEETGAQNIKNVKAFGIYEEYRLWYKPDFDVQHMISYCFTCEVDEKLGDAKLESYEQKNGMTAHWVNIHEAITHNENTLAKSEKKGISIEREIFLLKQIVEIIL